MKKLPEGQFTPFAMLAVCLAIAACGGKDPAEPRAGGSSAQGGAGPGASGGSTGNSGTVSGSGGGPAGTTMPNGSCKWSGSSWSCVGASLGGAQGAAGSSAGGSSGMATGTGGGRGSADGGSADAGSTDARPAGDGAVPMMPSMGGDGPSVTITEFPIPRPSQPGAIVAGKDGNLWFNHQSTAPSAIERMTVSGEFTQFRTSVTNIGPVGIAVGPDGNVWYTKQQGVGLATPAGQITERGVPGGRDSAGIVAGPDNALWFTEPIGNRIARVTPAGMFTEYLVPTPASDPYAITLGKDGNLWFTEQASTANKIGRVTPTGTFTEFPIPTPGSNPSGIAAGPDGNVWFTEADGHKIGRVSPTGAITEFTIPSGGHPGPIVAGPDGNLWFAEAGPANAIGRITPAGVIAEYTIPTPNADATGITVGPDGNIWFTQLSTNKVGRISNLTGGGNVAPRKADAPIGTGGMATMCTDDTDCVGSGKACGGDVCSHAVTPAVCVPAHTADPGWCSSAAKCWCMGEGATCDAVTHHCSITKFAGSK